LKKPQALIGLLAALGTALGVLVAVIGLPYGRADYTAFADLYHNGGTPALGVHDMAIDCDTGTGGVQSLCTIEIPGPATTQVAVTFGNNTASASSVGSMNFEVLNPDSTELFAVNENANPGANNDNPELNDEGIPALGNLACTPPDPDNDLSEIPGQQNSFLSCFTGAANGPAVPNDSVHLDLAYVDYTVEAGAGVGDTTTIGIANAAVSDNSLTEIGSCEPVIDVAMACFPATINFIEPPPPPSPTITNTPVPATETPTPTNTPAGPTVNKVPDCDDGTPSADDLADPDDNSDDTDVTANDNCVFNPGEDPAANLWLCEVGPCDDAGEGSLKVLEVATNVDTDPIGPGGIGLGAYEFLVEYDHFVISSVNPCDIVFGPTGAGSGRGPVDEVNSSAANDDCADDPNNAADGQCTQSLILENLVRFGCVTVGQTPDGPEGAFTLASLLLIPHEDLKQDLFPGNENGVVTIIKDNGCELVDTQGHAVLGSVNGGLTLECGDLAVTVRILEGDLDLDCDVDVTDAQLIATKYGSFFGSLIYGKWYDLEPAYHDLDIDIKDLQKVFGRIGSACQEPVPAQPPVSFP
jgi:hypothetical protein